ncbi:MAG: hypothetical protein AB7U45_13790 [Desulfamplus sp.]
MINYTKNCTYYPDNTNSIIDTQISFDSIMLLCLAVIENASYEQKACKQKNGGKGGSGGNRASSVVNWCNGTVETPLPFKHCIDVIETGLKLNGDIGNKANIEPAVKRLLIEKPELVYTWCRRVAGRYVNCKQF